MPVAHAGSKLTSGRSSRSKRRYSWVVAAVAVVVMGAGAIAVQGGATTSTTSPTTTTGTAAIAGSGPMTVVRTAPVDGATAVPSDATISVQMSDPVSPSSPMPMLAPPVAGSWQLLTPTTLSFVASSPFVPSSAETVTVPNGIKDTRGMTLGTATTVHFSVASAGTLRLQQVLATIGYLPLSFTPAGPLVAPQEIAQPQEGSFAWRWPEPASLESLWSEGIDNTISKGAVMAFESQHGMKTDGNAGPAVWQALLADLSTGTLDGSAYNYVYVSKAIPQTATVYSNGVRAYSTPANTGVSSAPTASGTFPVYLRYKVTTMSGTNPDGSKYSDPGIPWVSYFNGGDALHGFVRGSYGTPQSVGCVELPPANAAVVFPMTPIGTLVTVS
jgi:peptidoglycan hydrolase-like protein with peptidoglycan-binding domain